MKKKWRKEMSKKRKETKWVKKRRKKETKWVKEEEKKQNDFWPVMIYLNFSELINS